jgi:Holliday junction resolvase RusA-like endonuclease
MVSINFKIVGIRPKPWGTKEWIWRRAIATEAIKHVFSAELPERLRVCLTFRLIRSALHRADLDNLAKPVLDTLFQALRVQTPEDGLSGTCFSCDDGRVHELVLKMEAVESEAAEGVDIAIESM